MTTSAAGRDCRRTEPWRRSVAQYITNNVFPPNRSDARSFCRRAKRWLYMEQHMDCAVSMQRTSDGVTRSRIIPKTWTMLSLVGSPSFSWNRKRGSDFDSSPSPDGGQWRSECSHSVDPAAEHALAKWRKYDLTIFLDSPRCQNAVWPDGGSEFVRQYMHQDDRYISMLRQFLLLIEQFIRSRRSLFFRLMLTFSCCLHGFLRDQNFQTDRIPLTDITVFLDELWAFWSSMNVVDLRNEKSGSADLLTLATNESQLRVHDGVPQPTYQTVKPQTVFLPLPANAEQQCRQLQEIRSCRTSESRQPLLRCSFFHAYAADAGVIVVFISSRPFSASALRVVASVGRRLDSTAAGRLPVPDHEIYQRSQPLCCVSRVGGPLLFFFFFDERGHIGCSNSVDAGGLRVSDTDQLKFRCLRLGRMSGCVRKCRRIRSQLRKSDARHVMYRPTEPDHLRFRGNADIGVAALSCYSALRQHRMSESLCSFPMWRWVSVPAQYNGMIALSRCDHGVRRRLVLCLEPYCTRMLSGCNRHKRVRLSTLVDRTL